MLDFMWNNYFIIGTITSFLFMVVSAFLVGYLIDLGEDDTPRIFFSCLIISVVFGVLWPIVLIIGLFGALPLSLGYIAKKNKTKNSDGT